MSIPRAFHCALVALSITVGSSHTALHGVEEAMHGHLRAAPEPTVRLEAQDPQAAAPTAPSNSKPKSKAHSADPQVCTVLGALILISWIAQCAGFGGGAAAGGTEGAGAGGCISLVGQIAGLIAFIYVFTTGLWEAYWGGDQVITSWCVFLVILAMISIIECALVCCCGFALLGAAASRDK
eukprot:gnl/MRDRNA2_/MRDRNA2_92106_c0_seq1.p1 gnl/MRDRNA2_/MRDRNA2_92106_c0~~gnl/MRDRNA2_/MRDRNA2_92106_c0_seq1.p1  ORF type:complete len:181 (-),score=27.22 gnl/MRDRNA2_/MRDRNA2_92106_c0_seq1:155-697(-)